MGVVDDLLELLGIKAGKESKETDTVEETVQIAANNKVIEESVNASIKAANKSFHKPQQYDREAYQSASAMAAVKNDAFKNTNTVKDPYTGKTLYKDQATAKEKYGDNWQEHVAEADHIESLLKIKEKHDNDLWNSQNDIKSAANSEENLELVSRKFNNAKRHRSNEEFVEDGEYLKKTGVKLSKKGKQAAKEHASKAERAIERKLAVSQAKNIMRTAHKSGLDTAQRAASMTATLSVFYNISSIIRGEKDAKAAFKDILKDTGKATAGGYVLGGGLAVLNRTLTSSSSSFIKYLGRSNVAGKIVTAVISFGDTLDKYDKGEISTDTCLKSLGEISTNLYSMNAAMSIGQTLIPIPVVGAAIGAMVNASVIRFLMSDLYIDEALIQRNKQICQQNQKLMAEEKRYQKELQGYIDSYFTECRDAFDFIFDEIESGWYKGDSDAVAKAANKGIEMLGGKPLKQYESVDSTRKFLKSGKTLKV